MVCGFFGHVLCTVSGSTTQFDFQPLSENCVALIVNPIVSRCVVVQE